jgi:outer membrane protein assembly factor BamB
VYHLFPQEHFGPLAVLILKLMMIKFKTERLRMIKHYTNLLEHFHKYCACVLIAAGVVIVARVSAQDTNLMQDCMPNKFFNKHGNILIADQFNNRVIEVRTNGDIIWQFGLGPSDLSDQSPIGCNDAERVGTKTLIAATGLAPGLDGAIPNGAVDNRVLLVDDTGTIVWQYGQFGETGDGSNLLNTPVQCTALPDNNVLITDQGNNRIIEVNMKKRITWQYPGANTNVSDQLNSPNSAELLGNGHILISDENNNRVIEVTRADKIVKTFSAGGTVEGVAFASRLANGDTLITDSDNARIVEVNSKDEVVWQYYTDTEPLSFPAPLPSRAVRLKNGNTLISDQINNRVIEVNKAKDIVAYYGLPLDDGNNFGYDTTTTQNGINWPYDAKVIGDYTGLTLP